MSNIKSLRVESGYTQDALAEVIGEKRSTVAMWETGGVLPHASKLPKIAQALNCNIDDLFADERGAGTQE